MNRCIDKANKVVNYRAEQDNQVDRQAHESERKKGHWIDEETNYLCSECGRGCWVNSDYCPWCGADMRGDNNG